MDTDRVYAYIYSLIGVGGDHVQRGSFGLFFSPPLYRGKSEEDIRGWIDGATGYRYTLHPSKLYNNIYNNTNHLPYPPATNTQDLKRHRIDG